MRAFVSSLFVLILLVSSANSALGWSGSAQPVRDFDYDVAVMLLKRVDAVYDEIGVAETRGIDNLADAYLLAHEVVPFFEYEGITWQAVYPKSITFEYYETGREHNHLLGTTQCLTTDITLNARMGNPQSSWYGRLDGIATLVHELAHAQGICFDDRLDGEASAQLVTLEVLAAMANRGDRRMFAVLVSELRDMLLRSAEYAAMAEGKEDDYRTTVEPMIMDDAFERAQAEKARRYWVADPETRLHILRSYNFIPMQEVYAAIQTDGAIEGVKLPVNAWCGVSIPPVSGDTECDKAPLVIDDLIYVITNLEQLSQAYGNLLS